MQICAYFLGYFISIRVVNREMYRVILAQDEVIANLDIIHTKYCQFKNAILSYGSQCL